MVVLSEVEKKQQIETREGNAVCADSVVLVTMISNENFNHIPSLKNLASIFFHKCLIYKKWCIIDIK